MTKVYRKAKLIQGCKVFRDLWMCQMETTATYFSIKIYII